MTPVVRKRLSQVEVLYRKEEDGSQDLVFCSRPFVLCGLPLRRPPQGTLLHTRRNGKFVLQVQAHSDFGLPFGQDRLLPIWVATLAVRQQSRCVRFRSGSELLEEFGLPRNGKHYRRLIERFKRVFTSTGDAFRYTVGSLSATDRSSSSTAHLPVKLFGHLLEFAFNASRRNTEFLQYAPQVLRDLCVSDRDIRPSYRDVFKKLKTF